MGNNMKDGYADSNRLSDKALLIYNDFLHSGKFLTHYKWLKNAAEDYGIKLELPNVCVRMELLLTKSLSKLLKNTGLSFSGIKT